MFRPPTADRTATRVNQYDWLHSTSENASWKKHYEKDVSVSVSVWLLIVIVIEVRPYNILDDVSMSDYSS